MLCLSGPASPGQVVPDTTARIAGTVRSSINGLPISGVMVAVRGARVFGVSDSTGAFALGSVPPGRQTVRILYRDSIAYEEEITLKRGKTLTLSVLLDLAAVELSPIVVEAKSLRADRSLVGFYDRKRWGWGRFYTLEDLEQRRARSMRTLLAEAGVQVQCRFTCVAVGYMGARPCVMALFLDGMNVPPDYLDLVHPDDLAGVEVYKRELDVPLEFRTNLWESCGAVVMWDRY